MPILRSVAATPRSLAAQTGISQDNIIFALILLAFVIWIVSKGELQTYLNFFKPGASVGPPTVPVTATGATSSPTSVAGAVGGTLAAVPGQIAGIASGTASGIGSTIYNAVIGQPLKLVQGIGHSLGIPGM